MSSPHALELPKIFEEAQDFLPLNGTDHVELYCGNAKQSALYYQQAWGFQPVAYRGLETGSKDQVSYVLRQDKITLVLTSPLEEGGPINDHINRHGDGVKVVALWVDDAALRGEPFERGQVIGAHEVRIPPVVVCSGIHTYGDTVPFWTFDLPRVFLPDYVS